MNNSLEFLRNQLIKVEAKQNEATGFINISKAKIEYLHLHMIINIITGSTEIALHDAALLYGRYKSMLDYLEDGNAL